MVGLRRVAQSIASKRQNPFERLVHTERICPLNLSVEKTT